jgi:hypothetical protein
MSSLFNAPGEFLPNVAKATTSSIASIPTLGKLGKGTSIVLYVLAAIVLVLAVLMVYGTRIDLSWLDPRPRTWIIQYDAARYWKPEGLYNNLQVAKKHLMPDFSDDEYSLNMEIVLDNTRNYWNANGPYRHIAHRGSHDLIQEGAENDSNIITMCSMATSAKLPPFGLPKRMNPGILLDPNVNDILVFVDTSNGAETFRESVRIRDIPLDIPFRLGIVVNERVLEVYFNCKLEVTKLLTHKPKKVENKWFGVAGAASANAQVQNLYLWKRVLVSNDMRYLCPPLSKFKFPKKPPCPDKATGPGTEQENVATKQVNIGFGDHVKASCAL